MAAAVVGAEAAVADGAAVVVAAREKMMHWTTVRDFHIHLGCSSSAHRTYLSTRCYDSTSLETKPVKTLVGFAEEPFGHIDPSSCCWKVSHLDTDEQGGYLTVVSDVKRLTGLDVKAGDLLSAVSIVAAEVPFVCCYYRCFAGLGRCFCQRLPPGLGSSFSVVSNEIPSGIALTNATAPGTHHQIVSGHG